MLNWRSRRIAAGIAAALAVAAGGGVAYAATSGGAATQPAGALAPPESFLDDVANRVGVEPADLRAAVQAEALERLDEAVAAGMISEERAAEIRQRIEAGDLPPLGGPQHGHRGQIVKETADYLGLTPAAILDELRDGKSLAQVAEAHGKTADGLVQAILDAAKQRLDGAVADGKLTQEQGDTILERLAERLPDLVERTLPPRPGQGPLGEVG